MDIVVLVTAATILVRHVTLVTHCHGARGSSWSTRCQDALLLPFETQLKSHGVSIVEWRALKALFVEDGRNSERPPNESGSTVGRGHAAPLRRVISDNNGLGLPHFLALRV
jgi:hypothetical protein